MVDKIIDIGANLTNRQFQRDLPQVLRRAADAGVEAIVITGTSMRASHEAIELVKKFQPKAKLQLFSTVGVHPHDAKDFDETQSILEMRQFIQNNPNIVVAIGECGLDFNRDYSPRDVQERVFRAQVELACELQLPLFLHEREAHSTFMSVLQPFLEAKRLPPVVVHCFTGTESELRKYIAMGFYIGVIGFVCMDARGFKVRSIASLIPTDKLLIETDAPFMYPYGDNVRRRCEPKDLRAVVQTLASCFRLSPPEIAAVTTRNANRFFDLGKHVSHRLTAQHEQKQSKSSYKDIDASTFAKSVATSSLMEEKKLAAFTMDLTDAIVIDGSEGEGGGQVIRNALALAAILRKTIRVHSIRGKRKAPGLRSQHLCTVRLAQQLSGGELEAAYLSSTELAFKGKSVPAGGIYKASSDTGGSVSLMIQGCLPIIIYSIEPCKLNLHGGTNVAFSPTVDFMQIPFKTLLSRFGIDIQLNVLKRGFSSSDIGEVEVIGTPVTQALIAVNICEPSLLIQRVFARVTVCGPTADVVTGQHYVNALKRAFKNSLELGQDAHVEWEVVTEVTSTRNRFAREGRSKNQKGNKERKPKKNAMSIMVTIETSSGGILAVDRTGTDTPDYMAQEIAITLRQHVAKGVCMDEHLADNAIVYMALAAGTSKIRVPAKADRCSNHLETALTLVSALTGATYRLIEDGTTELIEVDGIGFQPINS